LVGLAPKTYRYVSKRPDDSWLRQRLKELASQRRRFGYRRLHLMLRREGIMLNWKKLYRLYREERLMVRKRGGRKRAQACAGNKGSNGDPSMREPTLVHRLCVRCARW
jgi:putative transposase